MEMFFEKMPAAIIFTAGIFMVIKSRLMFHWQKKFLEGSNLVSMNSFTIPS
jgi:hypothetical protein